MVFVQKVDDLGHKRRPVIERDLDDTVRIAPILRDRCIFRSHREPIDHNPGYHFLLRCVTAEKPDSILNYTFHVRTGPEASHAPVSEALLFCVTRGRKDENTVSAMMFECLLADAIAIAICMPASVRRRASVIESAQMHRGSGSRLSMSPR